MWRSVKGPKREAEALLVQLLHERDTGVEQPRGRMTVAAFLDRWLEDYVQPNLAPERLGHATVNITLDTHSHVLPGLQEAARRGARHDPRGARDRRGPLAIR